MSVTSSTVPGCKVKRAKILCIDDNPEIQCAIDLRLRKHNFDVEYAYFGEHGFWMAMQGDFDLVVTDYVMPQGDGSFFVNTIRQNEKTRHLPIIMLSGVCQDIVKRETRQLGIDAYLAKPINSPLLIQTISKLLSLDEVSKN